MYLLKPVSRPHASFTCPACRSVNVIEADDLAGTRDEVLQVDCLACGYTHSVHLGYMLEQLGRDLVAG